MKLIKRKKFFNRLTSIFVVVTLSLTISAHAQNRGQWQEVGAMNNMEPASPIAMQRPNGKVFAACGAIPDWSLDQRDKIEQFNLATLKWESLPDLPNHYSGCAATSLSTGEIVISGGGGVNLEEKGFGAGFSSRVYLYKEGQEGWKRIADMNEAKYGHNAIQLNDGRLFITGGLIDDGEWGAENIDRVEIYNFEDGKSETTHSMSVKRAHHQSFLLEDGRVLVAGGMISCEEKKPCPYAEIYDPKKNRWQALSLPIGDFSGNTSPLSIQARQKPEIIRWESSASALAGDELFIISAYESSEEEVWGFKGEGNDFKVLPLLSLNIKTGEWQAHGELPGGWQSNAQIAALQDGRLLVSGGYTWNEHSEMVESKRVYLYDPETKQWQQEEPLQHGSIYHSVVVLADGRVLIVGGQMIVAYMMELAYSGETVLYTPPAK